MERDALSTNILCKHLNQTKILNMKTLKIAPSFRKLQNVSVTANILTLHKKVLEKPAASISVLACEARNPLTSINLSIDMLQSGIKDNYQKEYLDIIMRNSIRINDTIEAILKLLQTDNIQSEKKLHSSGA